MSQENVEIVRAQYASFDQVADGSTRGCSGTSTQTEMREGRILRLREYLDRDSALEAAGLSE